MVGLSTSGFAYGSGRSGLPPENATATRNYCGTGSREFSKTRMLERGGVNRAGADDGQSVFGNLSRSPLAVRDRTPHP